MKTSTKINVAMFAAGILGMAIFGSAKLMIAMFCVAIIMFLGMIADSLEKIANK